MQKRFIYIIPIEVWELKSCITSGCKCNCHHPVATTALFSRFWHTFTSLLRTTYGWFVSSGLSLCQNMCCELGDSRNVATTKSKSSTFVGSSNTRGPEIMLRFSCTSPKNGKTASPSVETALNLSLKQNSRRPETLYLNGMRFLVTVSRFSPRFPFFVRRCFQVNPPSAKIRTERSGAPRRCVLRAQLPEMERPFAGMLGLKQPRGEEKEEEEKKKKKRRGEGRGEALGFESEREGRKRGQRRSTAATGRHRRGRIQELARAPFNARTRASTASPSYKDTERHRVVENWELSHIIYLFVRLFAWRRSP